MRDSRGTILHVIDTGGPGGAETIFLELVTGLAAEGWHSLAVLPERDWLFGALTDRGVRPLVIPSERAFDGGYLLRLVRTAVRARVGLIQTHLLASAVYGSAAARLLRLPLVATFHGPVDFPRDDRFVKFKAGLIRRPRARLVFVSESLRRTLTSLFRADSRIERVVPNGIRLDEFPASDSGAFRAELGIPADARLVGAIGNVRQSKDYFNLLRAAAILRDRSPCYRVVIAGDTRSEPLFGQLLRLRSELRLEAEVTFAGFRQDVAAVLAALDAFVLSSDREGFSLSTVQAMAAGKPVIATRCGGPEEIVTHGRDGWLVPPGDPAALAGAVDRVLGDPHLCLALARQASITARRRFSVQRMVADYATIYRELLGASGGTPS